LVIERIAGAGALRKGTLARVMADGVAVCVARTRDGRWFAVRDACSHRDVPLSEGDLVRARIRCPLHGSAFDLATGRPRSAPATDPVPTYRVWRDGDDLLIRLDER
jgi:3-phenylpropionate/trans-cinnamate dioxygenase ferredoxin subunit